MLLSDRKNPLQMKPLLERFHVLLFSIKDSIFPIHMIGKFCYKQEKDFVFLTENFRLLIENFVFLIENFNFF
jgi:hypothetical protein